MPKKPHETASAEDFAAFAEAYIIASVSLVDILAIPGVSERILEALHNEIVEAFDDEDAEDDEGEAIDVHIDYSGNG